MAVVVCLLAAAPPAFAADGVVTDGNARFHVISPGLVRLEYAADGRFEDRPTMLAFDRSAGSSRFSSAVEGDRLVIRTSRLTLSYRRGSGPFAAGNLDVTLADGTRAAPAWQPSSYFPPPAGLGPLGYFGTEPDRGGPRTSGNLGGWARGLDSQAEARVLHDGLLSRDGWFFIDDSRSVVLLDGGRRFAQRPARDGAYQDGYLFAYGSDYAAALADYRLLSGPAPLLPRKAFGVWFSRYFPYSEADYRSELLPAFRRERVPLDVLMVDTDFKAPQRWNGWNWRSDLFPDPERFLDWAHGEGLEVGLNVHPSISARDPRFAEANERAGGLIPGALGPAVSGGLADPGALADAYFTFDLASPRQLDAFGWLHEPFERQGADFWWYDWCCEEARVGPLIPDGTLSGDAWINAWYARRAASRGSRWLSLARMGASFEDWTGDRPGPWGEQRSTIHFTGDAVSTWEMLDFETRFTVAEGNVGLPYISHDIGGFQGSALSDELYARWVQSGAFQPILRLHSSRTGDVRRLPWEFGDRARAVASEFLRLRASLVPYLYAVARESFDTGLPMARGMYLAWPGFDEAYSFDRQYMLGSELLVAPVGTPGGTKRVWFPPGEWVDLFTRERFSGPAVAELRVPLERMPVFARAGGIVPRQPYMDSTRPGPLPLVELDVYAGANGSFSLYEDSGEGFAYRDGSFARTRVSWNEGRRRLTVGADRGRFPGRRTRRAYRLRIVGVTRPRRVLIGGRAARRFGYDAGSQTLTLRTRRVSTVRRLTIELLRGP